MSNVKHSTSETMKSYKFPKLIFIFVFLILATSVDAQNCGRSISGNNTLPLVMGGTIASEGAWPWMVYLTKRDKSEVYKPHCNGFLIDKEHVITVANCVEDKDVGLYKAHVGGVNLNEGEEYKVVQIVVPKEYEKGMYHDNIAILTLDREVNFPNFNPICLPQGEMIWKNLTGLGAAFAAWGADEPRGEVQMQLKQLNHMPIVSNPKCENIFRKKSESGFSRQFPQGLTNDIICAGFPEGGKDACLGDSGGPLMYQENNRWYAIGLSSFGVSCGLPGVPGAYTRVSAFIDWIRENTGDQGCGRSTPGYNTYPLVMGGRIAREGAWPWMVAIAKREISGVYETYCNGFLIDKEHVITAANCFENKDIGLYTAHIGSVNSNEGEEYYVVRIVVPKEYRPNIYHDNIAIIKLDRKVSFPYFNPICLPEGELSWKNFTGLGATVAGWGATSPRGSMQRKLHQLSHIPIVSNWKCDRIFREKLKSTFSQQFPKGITNEVICAGFPEGGKDACTGDSGAPLMYQENNRWYAIGLSSFGMSCGVPGVPGGYTRVSNFLDWIKKNTKN